MAQRFTIDGSSELERRLQRGCDRVCDGVRAVFPRRSLAAIVLGGGYGRGEGGVRTTESGDLPYNDLEFYVFVRGNRHWHEYRRGPALRVLGERLSAETGAHVEFKIESTARLRRAPVTMFSYDLAAGHRVVLGDDSVFQDCEHHLDAAAIPPAEATRLLWNRCSGLLLAGEMLNELTAENADFVARNLAKASLALGDAVLAASGQYHWSVQERHRRLAALNALESAPWLPKVQGHHAAGMVFKLHPRPVRKSSDEFEREHREVSSLALELWLWLESRRLNRRFETASEYAMSGVEKCACGPAWRNFLLTLRTFGPRGALTSLACRYPRERLFNALPLLLWNSDSAQESKIIRRLQQDLQTEASDRTGFVSAYKQLWPTYG